MKKHNIHSTLFALPPNAENKGHIWTSTISFFVKNYSLKEIIAFFNFYKYEISYNSVNAFELNLSITKSLCKLPQNDRLMLINELMDKLTKDQKILPEELLSLDEIKHLDAEIVSVASHGFTHPSFEDETDLKFIEKELNQSKIFLEKEVNRKVIYFAFPFGKSNRLAIDQAKKYYKLCFTGMNRSVDLDKLKVDPEYIYNLHRYSVHHSSAEEVFFLINGFHARMLGLLNA